VKLSMTKGTLVSHALFAAVALSFVGAKGCLGGDVSLGRDSVLDDAGTAAGKAGTTGNPIASAGETQAASAGSSGAPGTTTIPDASEVALTLDENGWLGAAGFGVSGPLYVFSDGFGPDGPSAAGACELAGHAASECAILTSTASGPPGFFCARGTVERLLDVVGSPGTPDYGAMYGAGIAFNFFEGAAGRLPYDASAHGVVGVAFEIDQVPPRGLRVELLAARTPNEPAAWKPNQSYVSPLRVGRNVVLFEEATPLPFYSDQSALDPTQILSVQFHVPTTSVAAEFDFCIRNLSLVLGTPAVRPPATNEGCPNSLAPAHGFAYDPSFPCLSPYSKRVGCYPSRMIEEPSAIPSTPAIANLPCVRRLSDSALFLALDSKTGPLAWKTTPQSAWPRLSASEWADCTAEEAALIESAPVCAILPI
jgi:hypothetical protein